MDPWLAFDRSGEGDVGVVERPAHDEGGEAERVPVVWVAHQEDDEEEPNIHRFAIVGPEIIMGRSQECDISIESRLLDPRHLRLRPTRQEVELEVLGGRGIEVAGDPVQGFTVVLYRTWFFMSDKTAVAVCRDDKEQPLE